ncbi:hypothetical protein [Aliikangiella maris]|uniref:DUF3800 domain-containing protein n=2 Tax=Aliikangiella maris TaxID=3162458 RepID=A0ABV3MUH7_9GAMM
MGPLPQETSTVFRVQGGTHPDRSKRSKFLIAIDESGNTQIKSDRLNISIGDESHADHFLTLRPGAEVVSFKIPKWMDEFIEQESWAQYGVISHINVEPFNPFQPN